jgi:hypothetical protein
LFDSPDKDEHQETVRSKENTNKEQGSITSEPMKRFLASMQMDYEKWHDGIGYDLAALDQMTSIERDEIAELLINRETKEWFDFEALEHINTPRANAAINAALTHQSLDVRIAAMRYAMGSDSQREKVLIEVLEKRDIYSGLSDTLDQIEKFHTPAIIDALLRGALERDGEAAVHFAAMLFYIHGKADAPFDWNQRPFFLRFHTTNKKDREAAFIELCQRIGVDSTKYVMD